MANLKYSAACLTDVGRKRNNNEDFVSYFEAQTPEEAAQSGNLYIVADGVGGAAKGERASSFATQTILYEYYQLPDLPPAERLKRLMREAGNHIFEYAETGTFGRMATTMVAAVVRDGKLIVAHVGDSRAYLLRSGQAKQLTRDHSLVGEMVRDGTMTEEESLSSKIKNRLTRSMGGEEDVHVDVTSEIGLEPGDRILLCTDGLTRYALADDLIQLASHGSPVQVVQKLVGFANSKGGADNVTSLLVSVHDQDEVIDWAATAAYPRPTSPIWEQETDENVGAFAKQLKARSKYNLALWMPATFVAILMLGIAGLFAIAPKNTMMQPMPPTGSIGQLPVFDAPSPTAEPPLLTPTMENQNSQNPSQSSPTVVVSTLGACEYEVRSGDTLDTIAIQKLGLTDPYQYVCVSGHASCKNAPLSDSNSIYPRMVLRFQGVDSEKCKKAGGTPISPAPTSPIPISTAITDGKAIPITEIPTP